MVSFKEEEFDEKVKISKIKNENLIAEINNIFNLNRRKWVENIIKETLNLISFKLKYSFFLSVVNFLMNLNNSVVIAKIKSIYGKRIKKNQFMEMSNLKNVESVTSYLKQNSNYNIILKDVDETNLYIGQLEVLLRKQIFINQEKIFHYLNKKNNIICNLILEEYELSELLKLILFINTKTPKTYRLKLPGFLISKCGID